LIMICLRCMAACVLFIIVISSPAERHEKRGTIEKKAWWNFAYQMLSIFGIGNSAFLFDYGCFCGLRGHGESVDTIDNCCQVHDACYSMEKTELNVKTKKTAVIGMCACVKRFL
ncbi:Hypothetical predicted protein, partial [Mytilus galloprovincialis]